MNEYIFSLLVLIFRIYLYISITILPFVLYNSFFESRYKSNSNYYHKKEWYYFLKVLWAKSSVNKYKKIFTDAIKNESDDSLEKPRKLTTFMRSDNLSYFGADNEGNSLYIRITLREKRLAESALQIRLSNGQVFQLPQHPLILISSIPERKWEAGGLKIDIIEPFSIIRITYNGLLRNSIRKTEYSETGDVTHCKFDFIWSASTEAKFFPQEVPTNELAEAVAIEPWKNPKWIRMLGFHTGFEQYGVITGYFTYKNPSENNPVFPLTGTSFIPEDISSKNDYSKKDLRLFGMRNRRWGPKEAGAIHRMLTLFGVDENGFMFTIGVRSYYKGCKELHIGSVMFPNEKINFVENCDISLPDFIEDGVIPGAFCFSFEASGRKFKCTAFIDKNSITELRNEEINGYSGQLVKTKFIINGDEAQGYGVFWYRYQGKGIEFPPFIIRPGKLTVEPERKYVTNITSPECRSINLAGIKGTTLALLSAIKSDQFETLNTFCILAPALDKYLEKNLEIKENLIILNSIACGTNDGNISEICTRIQDLFENTSLPLLLQELILRELSILKKSSPENASWCWTVRASVVHQHHKKHTNHQLKLALKENSFFDCFNDDDVFRAIVKCWAGIYDYNKVQFRRNFGLPIVCAMAVIIQPTLNADISGGISTQNPETGDPSFIKIQANYGLNLSINRELSDVAIILRSWKDETKILSTKIGVKPHKIIIGDHGIIQIPNNNDKKLFCLTKQQLLQISKAGIQIEKALGKAAQLEWAFYKDQLYILNAYFLPNQFQFYEILNTEKHNIISNTIDNIFNSNYPVCTLSKSIIAKYLDEALQRVYDGQIIKKYGLKKLALIDGKITVDQTNSLNIGPELTQEMKIHLILTTGDFVVSDKLIQAAKFRKQSPTWSQNISNFYKILQYCFWNSSDFGEESEVLSKAMKLSSPTDSTALEHFKIIKRNLHLLEHIIYLHSKVNQKYTFYQKLFFNFLHENPSEISENDLKSFLGHFATSSEYQISSKIELLAAVIKNKKLGLEFVNLDPKDAILWLENKAIDCSQLLEQIVQEFGSRGINDSDFNSKTWESSTLVLIKIVQKIIKKMDVENKKESEICNEIVEKTTSKHNKLKGIFLQWLDSKLHNIFSRRSQTLQAISVAINKFRCSFSELGEKLVQDGKLPNRNLIFHLSQNEIEMLVKGKYCFDLIENAIERLKLYKRLLNNNNNDEFSSLQQGTSFEPMENCRVIGKTISFGGHIKGRACILDNIDQIDSLQPGDILITKSLDIGWSPFFGLISGLICDTGCLLSQGTIAVLKNNIPCIIAENATKIFKTGDEIMMSANTGLIERIYQ